jgi:transcriptional regulator with XRE-family HTH domain
VQRELFERQFTIAELSEAAGYSSRVVANVLRGHVRDWPRFRTNIAAALGRPESVLFPQASTARPVPRIRT